MSETSNDDLPESLRSLRTRPLFVMRLDVRGPLAIGATPGAFRRVAVVTRGSFAGELLSGDVLDGAAIGRRSGTTPPRRWMSAWS